MNKFLYYGGLTVAGATVGVIASILGDDQSTRILLAIAGGGIVGWFWSDIAALLGLKVEDL